MNASMICGYVIDAICIGILLITVIYGAVKGFAAIFVHMIAFFASVAGGALSSYFLSGFLFDRFLSAQTLKLLQNAVAAQEGADAMADKLIAGIAQLPSFLQKGIEAVAGDVPAQIQKLAAQAEADLPGAVNDHLVRPVVMFLLGTVIFLLVFILLLFLFKHLSDALEKVSDAPIVGGVNRFLGGVMGLLQGSVSALLFLSLLWLILLLSGGISFFNHQAAETSFFLRKLTELYATPL